VQSPTGCGAYQKVVNTKETQAKKPEGLSIISLKYIQRIEGKKPPNIGIESIGKLAKALGMEVWKLLKF
jgi:hypothetical protein